MSERHWLAGLLVTLAVGATTAVVLGPLLTGVLVYRTSASTLHQIVGGDLAALVVVVPVTLWAAALVARGHPAGPWVALAPGVWALYMYAQLILGQEYLDLPGNSEQYFPLLLALFVVGGAVVALAWRASAMLPLPPSTGRTERTAGVVLLVIAAFLTFGLHLPSLLDALGETPTAVEYTSSPTAFWAVKTMDLGIVVPTAVAVGIGLLRGSEAARRLAHVFLGGYTLLGTAVTGMAVVMQVNDAPGASLANVVVFGGVVAALAWLTVRLHRPLFRTPDIAPATAALHDRGPVLRP